MSNKMTNENLKAGDVEKFERHICDPEIWEGEMSCKLPCVDELYALIEKVPEHIKLSGWVYSKPMFGTQGVYAEPFSGHGKQHIMNLPAGKAYFGGLAQYIAGVNPRAIKILLDRITSQQSRIELLESAIRDAAEYHQSYVDKLKESDPDRSARQQLRVDYFMNILENKS